LKIRESGMPDEEVWRTFFDVAAILNAMEIDERVVDVAEFGCGYGTFTIPVALKISGRLFALDIEPSLVQTVIDRAHEIGAKNVVAMVRDFLNNGTGLSNNILDYVMLFNILHDDDPDQILAEAHRLLTPGGKLGIIHWNYDPATPRGPPMSIRPRPEQCLKWARDAGFDLVKCCDLKPYHYGLLLRRPM